MSNTSIGLFPINFYHERPIISFHIIKYKIFNQLQASRHRCHPVSPDTLVPYLLADKLDIVGTGMDEFEFERTCKTFIKCERRLESE